MDSSPKVSVIVTAYNYAKYLSQCLDSVVKQHFQDWELIVVDDGSTDHTPEILDRYQGQYPEKIRVLTLESVGLAKACNIGIRASQGQYVIRLDADDYFDENILLVESNILDTKPDVHMVYSDYYAISKHGEIIDSYRLPKVNDEVKLLDRSPLAAGAMYRRECYDAIGGYSEELKYQEDYDFWIRFIDKFNVYNVNLPLMYYRKHGDSMSNNFKGRMKARQYVKKKFVQEKGRCSGKHIVGVIPAMGLFRNREKLALRDLNGKPLIAYTIEEALKCKQLDRVIVSTEDQEIAKVAESFGAEVPYLRPPQLAQTGVPVEEVFRDMLKRLEQDDDAVDIVVSLPYFTPLRKEGHITEAINTMLIFDTDSVISVVKDIIYHWRPGKNGLELIGYKNRLLREDRETVYKESGSIYVFKKESLVSGSYLQNKVGHIEMTEKSSWRIEDEFSFWVAEKLLKEEYGAEQDRSGAGS